MRTKVGARMRTKVGARMRAKVGAIMGPRMIAHDRERETERHRETETDVVGARVSVRVNAQVGERERVRVRAQIVERKSDRARACAKDRVWQSKSGMENARPEPAREASASLSFQDFKRVSSVHRPEIFFNDCSSGSVLNLAS